MKLIIGAGGITQPGWLSLEETDLDITQADQWAAHFAPNSLDAIFAEHVWEHLTLNEALDAARASPSLMGSTLTRNTSLG